MVSWHEPAKPYPKYQQLRQGRKRYRRAVASAKQWQAIIAAKCQRCRICTASPHYNWIDPHHLIPRDRFGDDVAENIVGLCRECHAGVEGRNRAHVETLLRKLHDDEYAYMIQKGGEDAAERIYGLTYTRA